MFKEAVQFPANTLKFSVNITNWPFRATRSILDVEIENEITSDSSDEPCFENSVQEGYLQWWKISIGDVSVYLYP